MLRSQPTFVKPIREDFVRVASNDVTARVVEHIQRGRIDMAEFCKQCSLDIFGEDYRELAGLTPDKKGREVICEGCGMIRVDSDGQCLSRNCLKAGKTGHGLDPS